MGAGIARAHVAAVQSAGLLRIVKGLVVSPLVGFILAFVVKIAIFWLARRRQPARMNRIFRRLQMVSAGLMAVAHGSNDAQKTMGVITMSLVADGAIAGGQEKLAVPLRVKLACAVAMAAGGVRIIKTMGTKIIDLKPIHGFAAETSAAITILTGSFLGMPVSTTHVITGCIMGAGASQRVSAVRWGVTTRIFYAWILTIPVSAAISWLCYKGLHGPLGE